MLKINLSQFTKKNCLSCFFAESGVSFEFSKNLFPVYNSTAKEPNFLFSKTYHDGETVMNKQESVYVSIYKYL